MKVVFPIRENWVNPTGNLHLDEYHQKYHEYFVNTAIYAGLEVSYDDSLKPVNNAAIPFFIDGIKCAYDMSDYSIVSPDSWKKEFKCYFMIHHLPIFDVYSNLGSVPQQSFFDWDEYNILSQTKYDCSSDLVLHCQNLGEIHRRHFARRLLSEKGYNLDTNSGRSSIDFWKLSQKCCVSVHIPGSTTHCVDRGQLQLIGLGVCTISPNLYCSLGRLRAEPNVHYVLIRDDYSDLTKKVDWCLANPKECVEIGNNAKDLFQNTCTPEAIWRYIRKRTGATKILI